EPVADEAPDLRLVQPDQVGRRLLVAAAGPREEGFERGVGFHPGAPRGSLGLQRQSPERAKAAQYSGGGRPPFLASASSSSRAMPRETPSRSTHSWASRKASSAPWPLRQ